LTSYIVYELMAIGTNIFAGTNGGVFYSSNNGTSWVGSGLMNTTVTAFAVNDTNIFVGTAGSGVWRRPLSEMITGVENNQTRIPNGFALEQNYPNPFNPSTVIRYHLSVISNVKLSIYDILGKEIAVLVAGKQNTGTHQAQWNAENLPSGVYFYRLQAGSFVETKKLVLLR